MDKIIVRNGEIEHIWKYRIVQNGFETLLFVRGTETEVREYLRTEYPHDKGWHSGCTDAEVQAARALGAKIYIAPQL